MAKTISVCANEPRASFLNGPLLIAHQPPNSTTIIIAIVGTYKPTTPTPKQTLKKPQHNTFLTLLSTRTEQPNTHQVESDESLQQRKFIEDQLLGIRQSRFCGRYLDLLSRRKSRLFRNSEHFCATGGRCFHGLAPSTFPGDRNWTFALGEASFDERNTAGITQRSGSDRVGEEVAPEVSEADRALTVLEEMLRAAVSGGLRDVKVVVSVSDTTQLPLDHQHGMQMVLLERLRARVFGVVIGWVEEGWVRREEMEVCWRGFGVGRRFGVIGSGGEVPFVVCDEGE